MIVQNDRSDIIQLVAVVAGGGVADTNQCFHGGQKVWEPVMKISCYSSLQLQQQQKRGNGNGAGVVSIRLPLGRVGGNRIIFIGQECEHVQGRFFMPADIAPGMKLAESKE